MGAFLLIRDGTRCDLDAALNAFRRKGFGEPRLFQLPQHTLRLYPKMLVPGPAFVEEGSQGLYAVGTPIYRGLGSKASLDRLWADWKDRRFDFEELRGTFALLLHHDRVLHFVTDAGGIQNVFYTDRGGIISSSFLATLAASPGTLSLDREAVVEVLAAGCLIGPQTIVEGIQRFEHAARPKWDGIVTVSPPDPPSEEALPTSFRQAIDEQLDVLSVHVKSLKNLADECGADLGLTGGYDSRLLLLLIREHFSRYSCHSHWGERPNTELECAEAVAAAAGCRHVVVPMTPTRRMTEEQLRQTMGDAMDFYDGLARKSCPWIEQLTTRSYRSAVLGANRLGLSGVGGEQYRNSDRLLRWRRPTDEWLKYRFLPGEGGDCFASSRDEVRFLERLAQKMALHLGSGRDKHMTRLDVRRFSSELYARSQIGARNNAENQISFFLSPYLEPSVAQIAYRDIPWLGAGYNFEAEMIRRLDPDIAAIPSDYGWDFLGPEPWRNQAAAYVKEFVPFSGPLLRARKPRTRGSSFDELRTRSHLVRECISSVSALRLPLRLDVLLADPLMAPVVIGLGYFLLRHREKIREAGDGCA
jgi:hypothetical protein